ncbi:MAG: livF [Microvirga sp.]|jgi:branched-chain amino acid transport system ATP-binding protein|uniref:ABC transporter ATP-binding protein n=1 Tax=Microvirga splendida TaxID=2795727 RepID=A0ABS0XYT2_9HYPH|nr:ABC transporter ATP-binding protein [Microvirga splendida]MBJ6125211.1 ABC transporter ATP-binding protein [Microvirga splendida]MCC2650189.1 livF [Microvirga sp.]MCD6072207.1 livF [Microvirga sp.]MDF2970473.1 livF [Microvirga sp.]
MLRLEGAQLNYGSFRALDGISIHAEPGELVVMLGANGAGKSSLFLAISGLRKLSRGNIWFKDQNIAGRKPSQIVQSGVVHCPEGRKLFPEMSVRKNLLLGAYVHRQDKKESEKILDQVFEMFPILYEKRHDMAGSLSGGQQQMVAIGRALMGRPQVLLLDEPSLGLAPLVVKQVLGVIKAINDKGTTVLLAEQNAYAALQIAHRAYVIESGRIVMEGDRDTLLNDERVRKAYIGA